MPFKVRFKFSKQIFVNVSLLPSNFLENVQIQQNNTCIDAWIYVRFYLLGM